MKKTADYIAHVLSDGGVINKEDEKICSYGIELFIMSVLEILAVIVLSALIGKFTITIVYLLGFMPLRVFSGGYHAKTRIRCFGVFLAGCILMWMIMGAEDIFFYGYLGYIYTIAAFIGVVLWAPVEHVNKVMSDKKRAYFRKMSIILAAVWLAAGIALKAIYGGMYTNAFLLGQLTLFVSMAGAKFAEAVSKKRIFRT